MDTGKLKRFATEARNILMSGVLQRLSALGFNDDGTTNDEPIPYEGGAIFGEDVVSTDFYEKWMSLKNAIQNQSMTEVAEEAAYTWFNRLVAIRIMTKNGLIPPVLQYESEGINVPLIVTEARRGRMPEMSVQQKEKIDEALKDASKTDEQFGLLIVAYCHSNKMINRCFGSISDYTELLLPQNILSKYGFLSRLNSTDFITDEDYRSPELIGWLYQFYIAEKKDNVFDSFKKGCKAEAKDIPAATQIFTPNWIVKYMVQNTVGRIYLDNNPDSELKDKMKYLVENENTNSDEILRFDELTELKVADLACGSGHILNECFDLLYDMYIEQCYSSRQAVENIFYKNLTGIDIDTRAKQLAQFALLLKACQKDSSFADAHCMPYVLDMPRPYKEVAGHDIDFVVLRKFIMGDNSDVFDELTNAITLIDDAQNLGSIMKFNLSERTRNIVKVRMEEYAAINTIDEDIRTLMPYMCIILALTEKYSALVMNPPYMGSGNMNERLNQYVKNNYEKGKADFCTVFMLMQASNVAENGYYANITPPSWMFLSTFEGLRKNIIENNSIASLLHLSRGVFGADFGSVSCVIQNTKNSNAKGTYFRLIERTFQEFEQKHLQQLFEKTIDNHNFKYYFADYTKDIIDIQYSENGAKIYYPNVEQKNFEKIPGSPMGYWISENKFNCFTKGEFLGKITYPKQGLATSDNNRFIRFWYESNLNNSMLDSNSYKESIESEKKWFPYCKGGTFRKWYGNREFIINWKNDGEELRQFKKSVIRNPEAYFKEGMSYSDVSSGNYSIRYYGYGFIFDSCGPMFIINMEYNYLLIMGILNTNVANDLMKLLCPTMHYTQSSVAKLPIIFPNNISDYDNVEEIVKDCISISRLDWDAHETSWDFKCNELVQQAIETSSEPMECAFVNKDGNSRSITSSAKPSFYLKDLNRNYQSKWTKLFVELHSNEEELNRQFIEIYGLQDELTPDVPLEEITILQQGEISIADDNDNDDDNDNWLAHKGTLERRIVWHDDVVMKQLISYAVGCMMGRYRLDKPGLILANQGDGLKEYNAIVPKSRFEVDDDGIIPLMPSDTEFTDNATLRFKKWLGVVFGEETLVENINFIEKSLGKSIDEYFVKDFWKDHKKMYQNRPIYWLFSSKKGAFQCLVYMHRMDRYTAEHVRTKYLLPHMEWLNNRQNEMAANEANLTPRERRELDNIVRQIAECREYHDRLHVVADNQIGFDLDDGVVVNYAKFGDVVQKIK